MLHRPLSVAAGGRDVEIATRSVELQLDTKFVARRKPQPKVKIIKVKMIKNDFDFKKSS